MYLNGIISPSTIDWCGKVSSVVFLEGCNLHCPYCSNWRIRDHDPEHKTKVRTVIDHIIKNKDFIDVIVISGGEPFLQPRAFNEITRAARRFHIDVGVHTNGTMSATLNKVINGGCVQGVMLDVKAPLRVEPYAMATRSTGNVMREVKKSLHHCGEHRREGLLKYFEVRTTVFPGLADREEEIREIVEEIECCDAYVLQQGEPSLCPGEWKERGYTSLPRMKQLGAVARRYAKDDVKAVKVRSKTNGDEIIASDTFI